MKKVFPLLAIIIFALVVMPAFAADYYVSGTTGVDNGTCDSENPCAEVAYVSNTLMHGGDTLYIAGEFSESMGSSFVNGTTEEYTTYMQWPEQEQAVFNYDGNLINLNDKNHIRFEGLTFTFGGTTTTTDAVTVIGSLYIEFAGNIIYDVGQNSIAIAGNSSDINVEGNIIYNTGLSGAGSALVVNGSNVTIAGNLLNNNPSNIYVDGGDDVTIKNNFIHSATHQEISFKSGANYVKIYNNSFFTDTNQVISLDADFSGTGFTANNNIFYNTSETGVAVNTNKTAEEILALGLTFDNNLYYLPNSSSGTVGYSSGGYTFEDWQALGYDANSLEGTDPMFSSTTAGAEDLHIAEESPAIDAGTDLSAEDVTNDYDGETRPYASAYDIGADEMPIIGKVSDFVESEITNASATISWTDPGSEITEYIFEYSINEDLSDSTIVEGIAETTYDLTGLTANTTYYYGVKAIYTTEHNTYESGWLADSVLTAPDAPTNFVTTDKTKNSITVSWTAPSGTMTEYAVTYYDVNDIDNIFEVRTAETSIEITDLNPNTEYHLACFALNGYSISESADFLVVRTLPRKVKKVKVPVKFRQANQVKVKWKSAGDDLKYQVKLMNKKGKKIKIYKTTKLNKVIKKLKADTTYKVRVRAKYDADTIGVWSKIVKFTTLVE